LANLIGYFFKLTSRLVFAPDSETTGKELIDLSVLSDSFGYIRLFFHRRRF
jgi:hypothetical protein